MLKIYNTLGREKEEFKTLSENQVSFYQCGPTVYWIQHIGNMRAMVLADLIRRSMEYLGYNVKFARNYTDVGHLTSDEDEGEDKMEKASKRDQLSPEQVAEKYIGIFEKDVAELNCEEPINKPRATQYISQMQNMVQTLLDKDYAYVTDLGIYFDISKFENYTKLSGQNLEMNQGSAGKGEVGDSQKKNSADFAIWFFKVGAHENALQVWPYTFVVQGQKFTGDGFPGWHLECSAMNYAIFGPTIDIHMGGIEHVPVHHTNEIAQSEAYSGEQFVRYWIHNEHLTVDGKKMSKSEGTVYSLDDIIAKGYDPMVLRYFFMQAHYRSKQNFTWEALEGANSGLKNLRKEVIEYQTIEGYNNSVNKFSAGSKEIDSYLVYKKLFNEALEDDFNIPKAVAIFLSIFKDSGLHPDIITQLILDFDKVLGLDLDKEETIEIPQEVEKIAEERLLAKQNKDFKKSDELREEIKNLGYEIDDTPEGYTLKKI